MSKARDLANQVSNLITISTGGSNFVTPQVLSASIANIDLTPYATKAQLSASVANIDVTSSLDSRIFISSASPTSGNTNGRIWIDPSTASAPVFKIYGSNEYKSPRFIKSKGSGGIITYSGDYTIHTFTGSGTFTSYGDFNAEILVIGGGGGGGLNSNLRGGGAGAGGYINILSFPITSANYNVSIGSGGGSGSIGSNTVLTGSGRTVTALGGGNGGYNDATNNARSGGSGGGNWYPQYAGAAGTQPSTTYDGITSFTNSGFGNAGGTSSAAEPFGAGGGGAGAVGGDAANAVGGIGKLSSISGNATYYAGGGGGDNYGGYSIYRNKAGGLGGGGVGYNNAYNPASDGTPNTGGGGGSGGSGGSGIVIIRYLT
jgi:hypothetical protein